MKYLKEAIHYIFACYSIKQHDTVEYLGCKLDSKLNREALASNFLRKINARLKFLYQKSIYLIPAFRRLLCNALIQSRLDCVCYTCLPLLEENLKIKIQNAQNKYIRFCLNLTPRSRINPSHIRKIKLRPATDRVEHCIVKTTFKY